ncbi:MAG: hypothetical protein IJF53_01855 [Clostridia bacterium]|nr:hypothetical protein [Clostridia bacterium]
MKKLRDNFSFIIGLLMLILLGAASAPLNRLMKYAMFHPGLETIGWQNVCQCVVYMLFGCSLAFMSSGSGVKGFRIKKLPLAVGGCMFVYCAIVLLDLFFWYGLKSDVLGILFPTFNSVDGVSHLSFDYSLLPRQILCITTGFLLIHGIYGSKNE